MIICDDVLHWAENTPPIRAMAMLCDPPYHLSGGFMGARWDKDGPDAIAFRPETWAALARHLLPGAFVMAFAVAGLPQISVCDGGCGADPASEYIFMDIWLQDSRKLRGFLMSVLRAIAMGGKF